MTRTITTNAISQQEAKPDFAVVEAVANGGGASTAGARVSARDRATTIRESLTEVSDEQLTTVNLEVEEADEMFEPPTDGQVQARERIRIRCVPETTESVVLDVTEAGGTIESIQFGLHEDIHCQLRDRALAAAMERAREKAERIAEVEGLTVGGIREVTSRESDTDCFVNDVLLSHHEIDFHPDPIIVAEEVEATFELIDG